VLSATSAPNLTDCLLQHSGRWFDLGILTCPPSQPGAATGKHILWSFIKKAKKSERLTYTVITDREEEYNMLVFLDKSNSRVQ
jgi:hypothetical protein